MIRVDASSSRDKFDWLIRWLHMAHITPGTQHTCRENTQGCQQSQPPTTTPGGGARVMQTERTVSSRKGGRGTERQLATAEDGRRWRTMDDGERFAIRSGGCYARRNLCSCVWHHRCQALSEGLSPKGRERLAQQWTLRQRGHCGWGRSERSRPIGRALPEGERETGTAVNPHKVQYVW